MIRPPVRTPHRQIRVKFRLKTKRSSQAHAPSLCSTRIRSLTSAVTLLRWVRSLMIVCLSTRLVAAARRRCKEPHSATLPRPSPSCQMGRWLTSHRRIRLWKRHPSPTSTFRPLALYMVDRTGEVWLLPPNPCNSTRSWAMWWWRVKFSHPNNTSPSRCCLIRTRRTSHPCRSNQALIATFWSCSRKEGILCPLRATSMPLREQKNRSNRANS